jgi:IS30 family transposase
LKEKAGLSVFFHDPHSPWPRATDENTNGWLAPVLSEGNRSLHTRRRRPRRAVAAALNARPRKTLGWRTAAETLDAPLPHVQTATVATTD